MAEITMSLQEYEEIKTQRDEARQEMAELRKKLHDAEMRDPSERVPGLVRAVEAALPVVKFAVGNLAPETVRGWPYDDLAAFAEELDKLPGADTRMQEYALEFRNFVREAQSIEADRRERDAKKQDVDAPSLSA
jgi:hypothetical protein